MKTIKIFILLIFFGLVQNGYPQSKSITGYQSLDPSSPIIFKEKYIVYKGDTIHLDAKNFFVDGQLSNEEAHKYPYVFNSVNEAAKYLSDGTETSPMTLYIAPYVYWIDDPDEPTFRQSFGNELPFGLVINCNWLRFYGLSDKAENVVMASNRGQTLGANGNFTLFHIKGDGTSCENVTFGNYCNIDLNFPLKPSLNRSKRASAIVQAQLIICNGDKIVVRNSRFISRLNLCPFVGGKRELFDRCHFECTDDALSGTAVYLNSNFDFYSSKPFYNTVGTGAVLLNCDINSFTSGEQYLTKAGGQVAILDTRFSGKKLSYIGWQNNPGVQTRNYQYDVSMNGKNSLIGAKDSCSTISLNDKPLLSAYRISSDGKTIYNTYNLLRGDDDWDPMGIKRIIETTEKRTNKNLSNLPTQLLLSEKSAKIETGKDSLRLKASLFRFGNYPMESENIRWEVESGNKALVSLEFDTKGNCIVVPTNQTDHAETVVIKAYTDDGLEAAASLSVSPKILDAPAFAQRPRLSIEAKKANFIYTLSTNFADESSVKWYRCSDQKGENAILTAVSHSTKPLITYPLSKADIGYFLMATIAPKDSRSKSGEMVSIVSNRRIKSDNVTVDDTRFRTDFTTFPTENQPKIIPGFWSLSSYKSKEYPNTDNDTATNAWEYSQGQDGASGRVGLMPTGRNASLYYTPVSSKSKTIHLKYTVAPFKSAGQGFSMAHRFMDFLIRFDAASQTGYGLRFLRTTKFGNAVDCYFVKYIDGEVTPLTQPVSISCFRAPCIIDMHYTEGKLSAHVSTTDNYDNNYPKEVLPEAFLETKVPNVSKNGFGINFMGGSAVLIQQLEVNEPK